LRLPVMKEKSNSKETQNSQLKMEDWFPRVADGGEGRKRLQVKTKENVNEVGERL
jgi:hypothetical protein